MSVNKMILVGWVGQKPELRFTQAGAAVLSFRVATNEKANNEYVTTWHDVTAWQRLAEYLSKHLDKGSEVYVEGPVKARSWVDKQGVNRESRSVVAEVVRVLDRQKKPDDGAGADLAQAL